MTPLVLPRPFSLPARLVPVWLHSRVLAQVLSHVLAHQLADGDVHACLA